MKVKDILFAKVPTEAENKAENKNKKPSYIANEENVYNMIKK